jgi:hypothetical protein
MGGWMVMMALIMIGGSFYLQSKIFRAKERIDEETLDKSLIKAAADRWALAQKESGEKPAEQPPAAEAPTKPST